MAPLPTCEPEDPPGLLAPRGDPHPGRGSDPAAPGHGWRFPPPGDSGPLLAIFGLPGSFLVTVLERPGSAPGCGQWLRLCLTEQSPSISESVAS